VRVTSALTDAAVTVIFPVSCQDPASNNVNAGIHGNVESSRPLSCKELFSGPSPYQAQVVRYPR